jgi:Ni,Fe-hydrogenase I cytochrome b subunit
MYYFSHFLDHHRLNFSSSLPLTGGRTHFSSLISHMLPYGKILSSLKRFLYTKDLLFSLINLFDLQVHLHGVGSHTVLWLVFIDCQSKNQYSSEIVPSCILEVILVAVTLRLNTFILYLNGHHCGCVAFAYKLINILLKLLYCCCNCGCRPQS